MRFDTVAKHRHESISARSIVGWAGSSRFAITESASNRNIGSRSLGCLNVCMAPRSIQVPEWGWPSASESCNGPVERFGSSLHPEAVPPSSSHFRPQLNPGSSEGENKACIVLIEDNPGDVGLIRLALTE